MALARSKLTAQGQISVPADIRKKLGVGPGSVLEWEESNEVVVVRRAGRHTSAEVHAALFPDGMPAEGPTIGTREGIRALIRRKHARS